MKKILMIVAASLAAATPILAQTPAPAAAPAPPAIRTAGTVVTGVQAVDNSTGSAKLNEYRDIRDDFYLPDVAFGVFNRTTGTSFTLSAVNAARKDQTIDAAFGRPGAWNVFTTWNAIPHNYSNKAVTPYIERSPGVYGVPATAPITFKRLATGAADAAQVVAMDSVLAGYQATFLKPTPLAMQTDNGRFGFNVNAADALNLQVAYDRQTRTGYKIGFGPIGDRPPRTLNIQLAEPVDHETGNLQLSAEHQGRGYQLRAEYEYSDFGNNIDTLRWQNIYTTAAPGADYDTWDRLVGTSGARPLAPDNKAHLMTGLGGFAVPGDGRVTAQFSYGVMEQDMALLPYSTFPSALANSQLPRNTAAAEMVTKHFAADYVTNVGRLNVRAFFKNYDLENNTPSSRWQYVTSDTSNLNGTASYVNKRVSIPYALDRNNAGVDTWLRLAPRTSLGLAWEREEVGRHHREADTTENVFRATLRTKASNWLSMRARFIAGMREGTEYFNEVTSEGYWYLPSEANDNNNPALTFDNHPDTRRHDVSDRERRQFDFTVNVTPADVVSVSAFVRWRSDDFDSGVTPTRPLSDTTLPDANAVTPGNQLGLLEDARTRYGIELFVEPNDRTTFNAFVNYDLGTSYTKSIEYNENNKANPSAINTAELGPWTRAGSQWTADTDDRTLSGGFGTSLQLAANGTTLFADYTMSLTDYDLVYGGFGVTNWDGTPFPPNHQFAFSSPPAVTEDLHVFNLRLEVPVKTMVMIVGYTYETYDLADWQQGSNQPWVESVGADTLLRDTSRSFQWGNRLFNLGTYLAPGYDAHVGFVGLRYRF